MIDQDNFTPADLHEPKPTGIVVPNIPLEEYEVPSDAIASTLGIENTYVGSIDYAVVGAGQAGGRLAKSFYDIGYKKALAINTATADLNPLQLPEEQKMLIGNVQGSGKNMDVGRKAADDASQRIFDKMKAIFGTVDKLIICIGCGGGTGAGGFEVLVDIAVKYMDFLGHEKPASDVLVIAALPTKGELRSPAVKQNNLVILDTIFTKVSNKDIGPVLLMDNSKIEDMYRGIPPVRFWNTINDTISGLFQTFNHIASQESEYTSFDAQDYNAVVSMPGLAVMGVTKVEAGQEDNLSQAFQDNFKKTLLAGNLDYSTANIAACLLLGSARVMDTISMDTFNYGFDTIHNLLGNADIHRGMYSCEGAGLRCYTFVGGINAFAK